MRKLTDEEVKVGAERIRSRHADEWAKFIYEATRGRSIHEASALIGIDRQRVRLHLGRYAALYSIGGGVENPPASRGGDAVSGPQLDAVIANYKPAEPDPDDVAMFEQEGFSTPVAETLATSYGAAEIAQEQQAIKVPDATRNQVEINAPPAVGWDLKLRTICADLMSAARTINDAKMRDLRRPVTAERLAKVHAEWLYQMERIVNIHEDVFLERVADHAEKPTL